MNDRDTRVKVRQQDEVGRAQLAEPNSNRAQEGGEQEGGAGKQVLTRLPTLKNELLVWRGSHHVES